MASGFGNVHDILQTGKTSDLGSSIEPQTEDLNCMYLALEHKANHWLVIIQALHEQSSAFTRAFESMARTIMRDVLPGVRPAQISFVRCDNAGSADVGQWHRVMFNKEFQIPPQTLLTFLKRLFGLTPPLWSVSDPTFLSATQDDVKSYQAILRTASRL